MRRAKASAPCSMTSFEPFLTNSWASSLAASSFGPAQDGPAPRRIAAIATICLMVFLSVGLEDAFDRLVADGRTNGVEVDQFAAETEAAALGDGRRVLGGFLTHGRVEVLLRQIGEPLPFLVGFGTAVLDGVDDSGERFLDALANARLGILADNLQSPV